MNTAGDSGSTTVSRRVATAGDVACDVAVAAVVAIAHAVAVECEDIVLKAITDAVATADVIGNATAVSTEREDTAGHAIAGVTPTQL